MHRLLKIWLEPVNAWIYRLDFRLPGNIHLLATAQIVEIGRDLSM
jgi:hypothetical protein